MKEERNPQEIYDSFWKGIVEKDGVLDIEAVKNELSDYEFILSQVPKVYCEVSGGMISKPNTYAYEVLTQFHEHFEDKEITKDDVKDIIDRSETKEELVDELKDYFSL